MKDSVLGGVLLMAGAVAAGAAVADDLGGRYVAEGEPGLSLTLDTTPDGGVTGTLSDAQSAVPLSARRQGAGFVGTAVSAGQTLPVAAVVEGDLLLLEIGAPGMAQQIRLQAKSRRRWCTTARQRHDGGPAQRRDQRSATQQ